MATLPPLVTVSHRAEGGARTAEYPAGFTARHCNGDGSLACLHEHAAASVPLPKMGKFAAMRRVLGKASA